MASYRDYKSIKDNYSNYLVLVKSGVFYETYNEDCKVIFVLFDYKIKRFKTFDRSGFPEKSITKVIDKLINKKINYIIVENGEKQFKEFENNNYNFYINKRINNASSNEYYKTNLHEELQLTNEYKLTLKYIEKVATNLPKGEKVLKDRILASLYDILELIYLSNSIHNRELYQSQIIAKLKMTDFFLTQCLEKNYITYDKYNKCGLFLIKIINLTEAWMISNHEKKS